MSTQNTIRDRVCRQCGVIFPGGPRAFYCPECRAERKREQSRRNKQLKRAGKSDVIGETIRRCEVCGEKFIIAAARQKYCKKCAPAAIRDVDRQQCRGWLKRSVEKYGDSYRVSRNLSRQVQYDKKCVICGKDFVTKTRSTVCSDKKCLKIWRGFVQAKADFKRGKRVTPVTFDGWLARHQ